MFLEKRKVGNNIYLMLVKNNVYFKNGVKKAKKDLVASFGNIANYDNGDPNFFEKLRDNFKKGIALIPELEKYIQPVEVFNKISLENLNQYSEKNVGYLILNNLFNLLGISQVLTLEKSRKNINYDILGLARLLVFTRFLNPNSKIKSFEQKDNFLFPVTSSKNCYEIYKVLDILDKKHETIVSTINSNIEKYIDRNSSLTYYDVTNYYFEIDKSDEDTKNKKGLRKIGVSKENRKSPIVQMGMFLDKNSIPIAYNLFPGNTLDTQTLRPAMKKYIDRYQLKNILIVADRGMISGSNEMHILEEGNDYLFAKSIRKSKKEIKDWVLDEADYISNETETFKAKSKIIEIQTRDENGVIHKTKEKILAYWSKDFYQKELTEKQNFIETLEKYAQAPATIPNSRKRGLDKYIITTQINKETGEILKTKEIREVNLDKLEKENKLMGYYILATSRLEMSDDEMLSTYKGLTKIENCFRILKTNLETRPVYVRTEEHINAHFLICFIALTMMRILQNRILANVEKDKKIKVWNEGMSSHKIQEALKEFKCLNIDNYCVFRKSKNEDIKIILQALGIENNFKIQDIELLKKNMKFTLSNISR